MHPRRHGVVAFMSAILALAATPSLATKPEPVPLPPPAGSPAGSSQAVAGEACNLGVTGPATIAFAYVLPPDDTYYTLISPDACTGCPAMRMLRTANLLLYFNATCEIPVTVSIVPAVDVGDGCLAPDLGAPPLCDPQTYVISSNALNQCVNYALPMAPCCIDGPAFLRVEFDQGTCANYRPGFCGPMGAWIGRRSAPSSSPIPPGGSAWRRSRTRRSASGSPAGSPSWWRGASPGSSSSTRPS